MNCLELVDVLIKVCYTFNNKLTDVITKYVIGIMEGSLWRNGFTDFQKATLIWNAPGRLRQEILDALEELSEETKDETLRRQINERLNYEKRTFKTFIHNQSGKYVYVVENLEYEKKW